ncbi:MAG: hypothetical protein GSR74_02075 [Desulfurococcales archaeon]|nr:hypothetical protein [Desulfurococcales archaeon]
MEPALAALEALLTILIIGYITINFTADLPRFLVGENLLLAGVYLILAILVYTRGGAWYYALSTVASFNAGRVSRSIVTPEGEFAELAKEHVPLLSLILLVAVLAFYLGIGAC